MRHFILSTAVMGAVALGGTMATAKSKHCPPGLAKKSVACVPPGQAKKHHRPHTGTRYGRGDILEDYIIVRNPARYNLDPNGTYYQSGGYLYQVDSDTRKILNLIGAVSAILN